METEDFFFLSVLNNEEVLINACFLWHAPGIQNKDNVYLKEGNYLQKIRIQMSLNKRVFSFFNFPQVNKILWVVPLP